MINMGSIYSVTFGLIDNERVEGFEWLLEAFDKLRLQVKRVLKYYDYVKKPPIKPDMILIDYNK